MATAFVALGSNLGDREAYLRSALNRIQQIPETTVVQVSSWIESAPVGGPPQGLFLNAVAELKTTLTAEVLLQHLKEIEENLGRLREHPRWGPRVIDLDLLSYDELLLDSPELTLPHPRMHERRFVLEPLAQIAPHWKHPKLLKNVRELLENLADADRSTSRSA